MIFPHIAHSSMNISQMAVVEDFVKGFQATGLFEVWHCCAKGEPQLSA